MPGGGGREVGEGGGRSGGGGGELVAAASEWQRRAGGRGPVKGKEMESGDLQIWKEKLGRFIKERSAAAE